MRPLSCAVLTLVFAGASSAFGADKQETSHLAFVTEYVRELAAIENIRAAAERQQKQDPKEEVFSNAVYTSTRIQFELRSEVRQLKGMRLNPPLETLIPDLIGFYERKIELHQKMIDISSAFVVPDPKPGIDYAALAAEVPKIRAALDYIDESVFQAAPLIFATLINMKPDSKNHASHLIITKAERAKLVDDITTNFGTKLDQKDQGYIVSAASVLRDYLLKDFKSSDDPWE